MKKTSKILSWLTIFLAMLFLVGPLVILGIYSFATAWSDVLPSGFTTEYYHQVFENVRFWPSVIRGLVISMIPIILSGTTVLLALYTAIFYVPKLESWIQAICMIPHTLKGVILAIAVLSLYAGSGPLLGNRIIMLTMVYSIIILPFVYQGIRNNLRAVPIRQLVEAAEILGASRLHAFFCVVVPNLVNGILVSALLGMSMIFGDFAIVKIIAGSQFVTVQQMLYNVRNQAGQYSSAIVLITFIITLVISMAAFLLQNLKQHKTED